MGFAEGQAVVRYRGPRRLSGVQLSACVKVHSLPPSLGLWFPEGSQELRGQWCFSVASPWPHVYITPNWANLQPLTLKIIFSCANRAVKIHIHMDLQNQ